MADFKWNPFTQNLDMVGTASGGSGIATLTGNSGGAIGPDGSGNVNVLGSNGIVISGAGNTLTVTSSPSNINQWTVITVSQVAVKGHGYYANSGGVITVTTPVAAVIGDSFAVQEIGGGTFVIQCQAAQAITLGELSTTTGGAITSTGPADAILLRCYSTAPIAWMAWPTQGNLTIA